MEGKWTFRFEDGAWFWECRGAKAVRRSQNPLPTFVACVADAAAHGYEPRLTARAATEVCDTWRLLIRRVWLPEPGE